MAAACLGCPPGSSLILNRCLAAEYLHNLTTETKMEGGACQQAEVLLRENHRIFPPQIFFTS